MKFKDYVYERPNLDAMKDELIEIANKMMKSVDFEEVKTLFKKGNDIRLLFDTMENIAGVRNSINTNDEYYEKEKEYFDYNSPIYKEGEIEFKKAIILNRFANQLKEIYGNRLFDSINVDLKAFSPVIIEELQEENALVTKYDKLCASCKIEFKGKTNNLSQMRAYSFSLDRQTRKEAETLVMKFFEDNIEEYDQIYDGLVKTRTRMAKKLGYDNYVALGYARLGRTDYDASMVKSYRDQVYRDLVPLVSKHIENKKQILGLDKIYSYDLGIDFNTGNPFPKGTLEDLLASAKKMYHEMSDETGEFIDFMIDNELLDLPAKAGKCGGGYCTYIANYKSPFIFSNFNGTSDDVVVLTHEAGHAFQVYSSRNYDIVEYFWPTYEACEIHSMSMEFFTRPYMEYFFNEDTNKYLYSHMLGTITFIPYGVAVDEFQEEVYKNPDFTPEQRKKLWRNIEKKYLPYKVYENEFLEKGNYWLRQSHIFSVAFYYIDYTLAQVCAHQFWIKDMKNHKSAWEDYVRLCECGGSKSFLKLLEVANLENPFVDGTVKHVVTEIDKWLENFDKSKIK